MCDLAVWGESSKFKADIEIGGEEFIDAEFAQEASVWVEWGEGDQSEEDSVVEVFEETV